MGLKVEDPQPPDGDGHGHGHGHGANPTSSGSGQDLSSSSSIPRLSSCSTDRDSAGLSLCRVCHCVEPDLRGDSALAFLGILPPPSSPDEDAHHGPTATKDHAPASNNVLEFVSPHGEIFVCTTTTTDLESGPFNHHDHLMDLGCSCKNDLALAHYACALKWFITHGSTVCEICGNVAVNVRPVDFNKVLASLKEYEALRERTSTGDLSYLHYGADSGVDPDAVAAIRRQRLCEISSWFNPQNSHLAISQGQTEQTPATPSNNSIEHGAVVARVVHARWSLEGTGVFLAIGLGVIVLAWLVAPHVGKKAAVICLHMLLGGLCALTIIISLRFVFPRIQYGSMRCWAILFVFWFLVFGVWASRTHSIRSS